MMKFLSLEKEIFGLDISDLSLKLIHLKKRGKSFVVDAFNQKELPVRIIEGGVIQQEDELAKIIKDLYKNVKGKKITTKYVAASLPEERSFLQVISMPNMSEKELASAIVFEVENYIPLPVSEVYVDFQVITSEKEHSDHLDVLIVAMPKKIVNSYVSCLKKAGLIPLILEIESESIARALIKNSVIDAPTILIDFGKTSTVFIIFSGSSVRFTCSIPISSNQLTLAIAESLKITPQEAEKIKIEYDVSKPEKDAKSQKISQAITPILEDLVTQIKKYVNFYQDHASHTRPVTAEKIENVLLCGGGANTQGLPAFLSEKLSMQVSVGNVFNNISSKKIPSEVSKNSSSFATALGLAQKKDIL